MIINNYDVMDNIVSKNNKMSWIGWDVAIDTKTDNGYSNVNGVFKNGSWYIRKVFPIKENGWNIPNNLVGKDVQVVKEK